MKRFHLFALILALSIPFTACKKEDPEVPNEEELITTVKYILSPNNGGSSVTLSFKDLDGDGGNTPVITGATLMANTSYSGVIELLNESQTPTENISEEIKKEDEEHQFFFQSTASNLNINYNDQDSNGNPIGLDNILTTGNATSGSITITLRHKPNKTANGVSNGDITNAGGETDIEVTFPVDVQ